MKQIRILLVSLLTWSIFIQANAQQGKLKLTVSNIQLIEGELFVSLCKDSVYFANFSNPGNSLVKTIPITADIHTIEFANLTEGWYAVALFQDLNQNDSLDTKRFRIPAEPFGFSNNALMRFKPPWFNMARFYIDSKQETVQEINLIYRKPKKETSEK
ncbi:MAG: DUF2141 domain-containing protein [Bacteroidales bacterium]|nr:DUF2141 domain-containing protein [Bacteroidales bacterium]